MHKCGWVNLLSWRESLPSKLPHGQKIQKTKSSLSELETNEGCFCAHCLWLLHGANSKRCAEDVGISRNAAQSIFSLLGERVAQISDGSYPSPDTNAEENVLELEYRKALRIMKERHYVAEYFFAQEVTFEEFQEYKKSGQLPSDELSEKRRFYKYTLFRTLYDFSAKTYGITRKTYSKFYSFCKFQFLVGIVIIELSDAKLITLENDDINAQRSFFCFQLLLLSIIERPLKKIQN